MGEVPLYHSGFAPGKCFPEAGVSDPSTLSVKVAVVHSLNGLIRLVVVVLELYTLINRETQRNSERPCPS